MLREIAISLPRYAVTLVAVLLSLFLQPFLLPFSGTQTPFLLFFIALLISGWYGGLGPGLLGTLLVTVLCDRLYVAPDRAFLAQTTEENLGLGIFVIEGVLISLFSAALHRAQKQARASQEEAQQHQFSLSQNQKQLYAIEEQSAELASTNTLLQEQISERLKIEEWLRNDTERLAAIIETQQDIANAELDLERVMNLIAERTQKLTRADGAAIALADGKEMVYRVTSGSIATHVGIRLKISSSLAGYCFRTNQTLYCPDVETDDRVDRDVCQRLGIRSLIVMPLRHSRKVMGVLQVLSAKVDAFCDRDLHTLQLMVGFIATAMIHSAEFAARQAMLMEYTAALTALQESEARFKGAFNYSAVGMALVATDGRFLQVNPSLCEMLGYSKQELQATDSQSVTYIDDVDADLSPTCRLLAGRIQKYQLEKRYLHKQGYPIWTHVSASLVRDAQNNPLHLIVQIQDITEQKQAEAERSQLIREQAARVVAEAAEQRAAFLAEASTVLASSLDYETTLTSVARLAVPFLADCCVIDMLDEQHTIRHLTVAHVDPLKEEMARKIQSCYPLRMNQLRPILKALQTGEAELISDVSDAFLESSTEDPEYRRLLQALKPRSVIIIPLLTAGQTLGAISLMVSESNRTYTSKDLALATELGRRASLAVDNARLYRKAQELNRMKDDFLATLSHELRTPLNSVLGWATLLRTRKFNEQTIARALETIERNARAQSQLVEDILDVSRIIQGKLRLYVRPLNLVPVLQAAMEAASPAAEAKGIQLNASFDASVGLILGDVDRLQQVIWNLLSNAVKFTPPGGQVAVKLESFEFSILSSQLEESPQTSKLKAQTSQSYAQIVVSDTGQGIKPEFLPFVFDRFRQGDSSMTRNHGGLGLGLAIVRHLVELHGGTVHVESAGEGMGATFTVQLPLMLFHLDTAQSKPSSSISTDANSEEFPDLDGLNVLVVDDEPDVLELLTTVLEYCGARVTAVSSAREAIATLQQASLDVLVSDIGMPDEDGYRLMRRIKTWEQEQGKQLPAAALTAYAREEDRHRALAAGFQCHLPKPVEPAVLASVVAQLGGKT